MQESFFEFKKKGEIFLQIDFLLYLRIRLTIN